MKKKISVEFTLGFALFAMFFGAGNLILPPFIGMKSGSEWWISVVGFLTTGIVAPFLGVLTIARFGTSITDLNQKVNPTVITILTLLIMICIGPAISIPRTASTTYEMGIAPLFPKVNNILFSILFFAAVYLLSISRSKIVDIIGNYLTPFLILSLGILITVGIINNDTNAIDTGISTSGAYLFAFQEGYQTLDVLASVVFAGIIIRSAMNKGYESAKERFKIAFRAGIVSMVALLLIYGGLIYLGAHVGYDANTNISRTGLLLSISQTILGKHGAIVISIAIGFACLTTAIALSSALGNFFEELTKGKLKYSWGVLLTCLISTYLSIKSVDEIVEYAASILGFIYPITFALILTVLIFGKIVYSRTPYVVAIIVTTLIALISVLAHFKIYPESMAKIKSLMPFAEHNLEWLIPAFLSFGIAALLVKNKPQEIAD